MNQFRAMRIFERVAERGSLTAASIELGLARGAASATVAELERYLGVQLLERSTRKLRLTEDGQTYLQGVRRILADVAMLEEAVGSAERQPRGLLRVQVPPGLARLVVAPDLPEFSDRYPEVQIHLLCRNSLPDFAGDRVDAAVYVGPLPDLDIIARPVGRLPFVTVAAPGYLQARGTPVSPADLARHRVVQILSSVTQQPLRLQFREHGRAVTMEPSGPLAFDTAEAAVAAAVRGGGILQLARYLVSDEVRSGKLTVILDPFRPSSAEMNVIYPRHRLKPRKLRVFEEFLRELNVRTRRKWGVSMA